VIDYQWYCGERTKSVDEKKSKKTLTYVNEKAVFFTSLCGVFGDKGKKGKKTPPFLGANLGSWVKSRELKPTRVQIKFVNCYVY